MATSEGNNEREKEKKKNKKQIQQLRNGIWKATHN